MATIVSCSKSDSASAVLEKFRAIRADFFETIAASSTLLSNEIMRCSCATESFSTVILNRLKLLAQQNIEGASELYNVALSIPPLTEQFIKYSDLAGSGAAIILTFSIEIEKQINNVMSDIFSEDCLKQRAEFLVPTFDTIDETFKSFLTNKTTQTANSISLNCKEMIVIAKSFKSALKKKCGTDGDCTLQYVC